MNDLSWFIYLAEVIPNIGDAILSIAIIGAIALIVWLVILVVSLDYPHVKVQRPKPYYYALVVTLLVIHTFIPSKETIYLIAGSEAGEMVITSEEGQAILNDIHEVIRAQLEGLKE